jgi:hypothetical protein
MKKVLIFFAFLPTFLYAGVIVKQSGERLEDVTIKSVTESKIVYVINGEDATLPKSDASAILYDDGRYEEISYQTPSYNQTIYDDEKYVASQDLSDAKTVIKQQVLSDPKEYNVFAYGVVAPMVGYIAKDKYDGTTVEYRIIYKSGIQDTEFRFLGVTPFAHVTDATYDSPIIGKANPTFVKLIEPTPLVIENAKDVKRIEFRLSKEGYKTTIVKPVKDILLFGGGPVLMISLNQMKPLKGGEDDEIEISTDNSFGTSKTEILQTAVEPAYEQAVVMESVSYEPVYEESVYETPASKKQKASKSSSRHEEPVYEQAVEVAIVEKDEVPVEQPVEVAVAETAEEPIVEEPQITAVTESEIIFKVDTRYLSFPAEGGSQQVYVEANCPWQIYSSPEWTEVRRLGGRLTIICAENTQLSDREDDIVLRLKQGQIIRITVAQDKNGDVLNLSANMVNENDGDGGSYVIYVRANKPYKASTIAQWCRVNASADSLVLSLDENRSGRDRQCEVEVMVSEQLKKTIIVKQVPLQHYVLVSPQIVTATKRGGSISIHVDSNEKWRVVNLPAWCLISEQTNDSFLLEISPNDTSVSRTGSFSVSAYGIRKSVTVKQE